MSLQPITTPSNSSVVTLRPPVQDDAVGFVAKTIGSPLIQKYDGDVNASYGDIGFGTAKMRAYALWDVSSIPDDAVVSQLEVRNYIWPPNDPDHTTQYRRLGVDPRETGGSGLWSSLENVVYAQFVTGTAEGYRTTTLSGTAISDFTAALASHEWFAIGITEDGDSDGEAEIAGYDQALPSLVVTYSLPSTPLPQITSAEVSWASAWSRNRVLVSVRNAGGDAMAGCITFEFPDLSPGTPASAYGAITHYASSGGRTLVTRTAGEIVYTNTCQPVEADCMMLEACWDDWPAGEDRFFRIQIDRDPLVAAGMLDAASSPRFVLGYRTSLQGMGACNWYGASSYVPLVHGAWMAQSQQGWAMSCIDLTPNGLSGSVATESASWGALKALYE